MRKPSHSYADEVQRQAMTRQWLHYADASLIQTSFLIKGSKKRVSDLLHLSDSIFEETRNFVVWERTIFKPRRRFRSLFDACGFHSRTLVTNQMWIYVSHLIMVLKLIYILGVNLSVKEERETHTKRNPTIIISIPIFIMKVLNVN